MILNERIECALIFAASKHAGQTRKGSEVPYITHPVAVAMLVHEHGGTENQIIAALLHDTVEDCGGLPVLEEIREGFGEAVADMVSAMTDSLDRERESWRERKQRALDTLTTAGTSVQLVAVCDKLHNVRSMLADYRRVGERTWDKFHAGREEQLWYYRELTGIFRDLGYHPELTGELERTLQELENLIRKNGIT